MSLDLIIGGVILVLIAVLIFLTYQKAKKSKIIQFRFLGGFYRFMLLIAAASTMYLYVYYSQSATRIEKVINDSKENGVQAFLDYEQGNAEEITDEATYVEEKTKDYLRIKNADRSSAKLYGWAVVCLLVSQLFSGMIITEEGGYFLTSMTPKPLKKETGTDSIALYSENRLERPLCKFKKTEEMERKLSCFLEVERQPEEEKQQSEL